MPISNEKYMLLPCSGRAPLKMSRGHVYLVTDREGNEIDFLTEQQAFEKYGRSDCFISSSDTLCKTCLDDILNRIKKRQSLLHLNKRN